MAQYTSNIGLHQWEPSDHFLRTDFNQDFSKIDAGFFWLEGALARSGYEVLQARLAEESKGAVPMGRGMLFDSFRSGERVSLSGGLGMRPGGGLLLDTGTGLVDFEDHFGTDEYYLTTDSAGTSHYNKQFTAAGNGVLRSVTVNLAAPKGGNAGFYVMIGSAILWQERREIATDLAAYTFQPEVRLQKGVTYTIRVSRMGDMLRGYYATGGKPLGYRAVCTPAAGKSGTVITTAQTMDPFRSARVWLRHSAGTVTCELQRGGGAWQSLSRTGSRSTVDCRNTSCTETEFKLPIGQAQGGSTRLRFTIQNSTDAILYDYGAVLI